MTLAGILCVRNGDKLDYCWEISGQSLLGVCDELVLCDCDSDDGTTEKMIAWAARDKRVRVFNFPWTNPVGDNTWWPTWVNFAREKAISDWVICLDADEVLHENSYAELRRSADEGRSLICKRHNFWRDSKHIIPHGKGCGFEVIRVGPQNLFVPSDYPEPRAQELMRIAQPSGVEIMHYGFLRKKEEFFAKSREVLRIWNNSYDERLENAEKSSGNWMENPGVTGWENELMDYTGTHPEIAKQWLRDRNYEC